MNNILRLIQIRHVLYGKAAERLKEVSEKILNRFKFGIQAGGCLTKPKVSIKEIRRKQRTVLP